MSQMSATSPRTNPFPSVRGRRGMRGPALAEGPRSGAVGQPAATDGASPASTVTLLSERKSSELWRRYTPTGPGFLPRLSRASKVRVRAAPLRLSPSGVGRTLRSGRAAAPASSAACSRGSARCFPLRSAAARDARPVLTEGPGSEAPGRGGAGGYRRSPTLPRDQPIGHVIPDRRKTIPVLLREVPCFQNQSIVS